jgi:hypothetical protein
MSTFLKIYDEKSYLEVGLLDGYISIATDYNVEDGGYPAYTEVKLNKTEVDELIEFLQKRRDEME